MRGIASQPPDLIPVLSPGRHRNPRKGACFMEMASYLAGERWSDHPSCTHPVLALLARMVNDGVADDQRSRLIPLIPSVIGLTGDDLRVDAHIALRCATTALPIASATRQHALAVGILSCERLLAELDGQPSDHRQPSAVDALRRVPESERWAQKFSHGLPLSRGAFRRQTAPRIVSLSVEGIAEACVSDPETRLIDLLEQCIAQTRTMVGLEAVEPAPMPAPPRAESRARV
jgi:hypothetical protein